MITLTGTEKQIAWASDIRNAAVAKWKAVIAEWIADDAEYMAPQIADARAIIDRALTVESASAWIESRTREGANPWRVIAGAGTGWAEAARDLGMDARVYMGTADALA